MRPLAFCLSSWLGSQLGALPTYTLGLGGRVGWSTCPSWLSSTALLLLLVPGSLLLLTPSSLLLLVSSPLLVLGLVHRRVLISHLVEDVQGDVVQEASIV